MLRDLFLPHLYVPRNDLRTLTGIGTGMALGVALLLILNKRELPSEIGPTIWRKSALSWSVAFFGVLALLTIWQQGRRLIWMGMMRFAILVVVGAILTSLGAVGRSVLAARQQATGSQSNMPKIERLDPALDLGAPGRCRRRDGAAL